MNWFQSLILKIFGSKEIQDKVLGFMFDASTLIGKTGDQKKEWVINKIIEYQQNNIKVGFMPKELQISLLTWIVSSLIELLYKKYFKK